MISLQNFWTENQNRSDAKKINNIPILFSKFQRERLSSSIKIPKTEKSSPFSLNIKFPLSSRSQIQGTAGDEGYREWIYASFVHVRYTRGRNEWSVNYSTLEARSTFSPLLAPSYFPPVHRPQVQRSFLEGSFYLLFHATTEHAILWREKFHLKIILHMILPFFVPSVFQLRTIGVFSSSLR